MAGDTPAVYFNQIIIQYIEWPAPDEVVVRIAFLVCEVARCPYAGDGATTREWDVRLRRGPTEWTVVKQERLHHPGVLRHDEEP
jgi:hypothetical protein